MTRAKTDVEAVPETQQKLSEQSQLTLCIGQPRKLSEQLTVLRVLPQKGQRMLGPWCFLDHIGPVAPEHYRHFDVAPHPHIGLQTITWLFSGDLQHLDSLGYKQPLRANELNLMTSGKGISHAEVAAKDPNEPLHGLQLWAALPPQSESIEPSFHHYRELPSFAIDECQAQLILGEYVNHETCYQSPAQIYHPTIALMLSASRSGYARLALNPAFEYGLYVCTGKLKIEEQAVVAQQLVVLNGGREWLDLTLNTDTKVLLLGGEPFQKPVQMWWNFVSSDKEKIRVAEQQWNAGHERFGEVKQYQGERLLSPPVPF